MNAMTATLPPQNPADDPMRSALIELCKAYVRLLESGRDRIMDFGGTCDGVDIMEASDPALRAARASLALQQAPIEPESVQSIDDSVREAVLEAWASYERFGEVCPFEGQSMIYASTLEELFVIASQPAPVQQAPIVAPVAEQAHAIGRIGAPHNEAERALFCEYLRGHCWGQGQWHADIADYADAFTRLAYAVWRARAALATAPSVQPVRPAPPEIPKAPECAKECQQAVDYGVDGQFSCKTTCVYLKFPSVLRAPVGTPTSEQAHAIGRTGAPQAEPWESMFDKAQNGVTSTAAVATIDYARVHEFATEQHISYNETCVMLHAAISPPAEAIPAGITGAPAIDQTPKDAE